jgi:riboflavin kinase/FMN adenylyltransferase
VAGDHDEVVHGLDGVAPAPSVVTIGVFDGVHRGHRAILDRATDEAARRGVRSVAVTFDPHPMVVVRPDLAPRLLQRVEDRAEALAAAGLDLVVVLPFTEELSRLSPAAFVDEVVAGRLGAEQVVVGRNFRFGHRAAGDVSALAELGRDHGFEVEGVSLLDDDGTALSSTDVRSAIERGEVAWAATALGRPWRYVGEVVRGDGRGRTIDVPTANVVAPPEMVRPGGGVYAARATSGDRTWDAVVNVGTRPTFDGTTTTVEAHLLDVDDGPEAGGPDLYGRTLAVALLARLRDERRFDGPDDLVAQIRADIEAARAHLGAGAA